MTSPGRPNYHHLLGLGLKKITQADLKKAFGTVLFDEIFDWVHLRLTKSNPLELSDIVKLSENRPGLSKNIQMELIDEMKMKWTQFTRDYTDREGDHDKTRFLHEVAPLSFIRLATRKYRTQLQFNRIATRSQTTPDGDPVGSIDEPETSQLLSVTEDGRGEARRQKSCTRQDMQECPGKLQKFEFWDTTGSERLFLCFMVELFDQDLHYGRVESLYRDYRKASGRGADKQVSFIFVDKQATCWTVFEDTTLRSAFRQYQVDASAHPFFLLVDDRMERPGPPKSPYEPVKRSFQVGSPGTAYQTRPAIYQISEGSGPEDMGFEWSRTTNMTYGDTHINRDYV